MDKSSIFYLSTSIIFLNVCICIAQPNCKAYLYQGDLKQYEACKLIENAHEKYYQFDERFHELMESSIKLCPYFAYAYWEISAAYIKSGNFIQWKKHIDKAVKYDPESYLGERASLRFKFFADYKGAIKDIDSLNSITSNNIGYSHDGMYHLNIIKGLCLMELGKLDEAAEIISKQSEIEGNFSRYNHLHLGVLHFQKNNLDKAIEAFKTQAEINNIAENQYYLAITYRARGEYKQALKYILKSQDLFFKGYKMQDPYHTLIHQIFETDINKELSSVQKLIYKQYNSFKINRRLD